LLEPLGVEVQADGPLFETSELLEYFDLLLLGLQAHDAYNFADHFSQVYDSHVFSELALLELRKRKDVLDVEPEHLGRTKGDPQAVL